MSAAPFRWIRMPLCLWLWLRQITVVSRASTLRVHSVLVSSCLDPYCRYTHTYTHTDRPLSHDWVRAWLLLLSADLQVNGSEARFAKQALFTRHLEMIDWPSGHGWFFAKFNITQVIHTLPVSEPLKEESRKPCWWYQSLFLFQVWILDYFGGIKTVSLDKYFHASPYRKYLWWSKPHPTCQTPTLYYVVFISVVKLYYYTLWTVFCFWTVNGIIYIYIFGLKSIKFLQIQMPCFLFI